MLEKNLKAFERNHQDILNEYWTDIENVFASLEAIAPHRDDLMDSTRWRYCQTNNKKDRKKIGYLCQFGWNQNYPFVQITVNNFKLGKATFNSAKLDKEKRRNTEQGISFKQTVKTNTLPKAVYEALQKEKQQQQQKRDLLAEKKRDALFKEKWSLWQKASAEIQSHPYAIKKQLTPNKLLRQSNDELLYPLTHIETGKIVGVQTIHANGEKRFYGQQKNAYAILGNLEKAAVVYLCEGYATANAVFQLAQQTTSYAVINTLNCHNLIPIAQWIKKTYLGKKIIIAADNDAETAQKGKGNAGLWYGSKAAMLTQGTLLYPENEQHNIDWCDAWVDSKEKALTAFHSSKKRCFKEIALTRLSYAHQKIRDAELVSAVRDVFQLFLSDYPLKHKDEAMLAMVQRALIAYSIPFKKIKSLWKMVKKQYFSKALRAKTFTVQPKKAEYTVTQWTSLEDMRQFVEAIQKEYKKAIFLTNAPMGTGKTQKIIQPAFQQLAQQNYFPVIITPTCALTQGVAERLNTAHYQHDKETLTHKTGLAITVNSIIKEPFEPFLEKTRAVFIDEYTQVLRSITSGTVEACARQKTHQKLSELIHQSDYVVIADADLNQIALNEIAQSAEADTPIIVMTLKKSGNETPYQLYPCSPRHSKVLAIYALEETVQKKEPCYVVTDSKKRVSVYQTYCQEAKIPHLVISSDTLKTQATQAFLKNPDAFLAEEKPLIVIVSPAVQSGLSIESDYFQKVLGVYTGTVTPTVFHQMVNRVRKPVLRDIILVQNYHQKTYGNENAETLLTESYQHYIHQFGERQAYVDPKTGIHHIGRLHLQRTEKGLLVQGDPIFERFERLSTELKALDNQQKNHAQAFFALHLMHEGITVETPPLILNEETKKLLKQKEQMTENTAMEERYNALCGKNELTRVQYRHYNAKTVNTPEEIHAIQRFDIAETLSIHEIKPADVDFFDNQGKKILENYDDLKEGIEAAQKKDEIEKKQAISKNDMSLYASKVALLTLIFDTLGIDINTGEGTYHHEKAKKARYLIRENDNLVRYILLKLSLSVNSNLSDVAFINKILKKLLGLKAERSMNRKGEQRLWYYNIRESMKLCLKYMKNDDFISICHQK